MDFETRRRLYYEDFNYPGEPEGPRRRWVFVFLAIVFLGGGLSLVGAAGYLYLNNGGNDGTFVYVRPSFEGDPVAVAAAAQGPDGESTLGSAGFRLVIDKIGVNADVAPFGMGEDLIPDVPFEKDLVAWYTFSAYPGTGENTVLAGHVTYYGDAVFKHIGDLQPGDRVTLQSADGELVYQVSGSTLINEEETDARYFMEAAGAGDILTLITCGGEHYDDPDSPLGGGYTHRLVVRAELVAVATG